MKKSKVVYYIAGVFLAGLAVLIYLSLGQSEKTVPKIRLSYFKSNSELTESIHSILQQQILKEKYFWFGIEPGIPNQLEILSELKSMIEKSNKAFDVVYIDQELRLSNQVKNLFGNTLECEIKSDWSTVAKDIKKYEGKNILFITASIYSTNLLQNNPIHKINKATEMRPMTFSMGYFSADTDDEKRNVFPCKTDDKEGVSGWGCLVVNKSRSVRRKININKIIGANPLMIGIMDLTGEKDYMLLVR